MKVLSEDTRRALGELVSRTREHMLICSPFIGRSATTLVVSNFNDTFRRVGNLTIVTDLSPLNVAQGATDPHAIMDLCHCTRMVAVRHLPKVHAKVYVGDTDSAIVTSANLTAGGLLRNFEYGVKLDDATFVTQIRQDILEYGRLGADVSRSRLEEYCDVADRLRATFGQTVRSSHDELRVAFDACVADAQDRLLELRLAQGPIHTVFARTIEFLLRLHGPTRTQDLHPLIQKLHPDLCDDSVDRVIDGKRFGKKWKHAVRSAQQQLKQRGIVRYEDGLWRLCRTR